MSTTPPIVDPLTGSFHVKVSLDGESPFSELLLFTAEGGVVEAPPDHLSSTGIGTWQGASNNTYAVKIIRFIAQPQKQLVLRAKITATLTLSADGTEIQGQVEATAEPLAGPGPTEQRSGQFAGKRISATTELP